MHAVDKVKTLNNSDCQQVVFLSDAKSVLEALQNDKLPELRSKLDELAPFVRIIIQWIPAHCGVPGNEAADRLAKQGAKEIQYEHTVTYREKKTIIKNVCSQGRNTKSDPYHQLDRWEQVLILRLRTGHSKLKGHLHSKLKVVTSPNCACGREETPSHILQTCPLYNQARTSVWPTPVDMKQKLYGCL